MTSFLLINHNLVMFKRFYFLIIRNWSHTSINPLHQPQIRRQPFHAVKLILSEPSCFLSLQWQQIAAGHLAPEAVHRQVEVGVIVLDSVNKLAHFYFSCKLLTDFSHKRLLRSFTGFDFTAGKFPQSFELTVSSCGCKNACLCLK